MPIADEKQPLINKESRTDYLEGGDGETSAGGKYYYPNENWTPILRAV